MVLYVANSLIHNNENSVCSNENPQSSNNSNPVSFCKEKASSDKACDLYTFKHTDDTSSSTDKNLPKWTENYTSISSTDKDLSKSTDNNR